MTVIRIVADIETGEVEKVSAFYSQLFGLDTVMNLGWIATLSSGVSAPVQISIAAQGGSGAPVPRMSIEVDDVDAIYSRAKQLGYKIPYDLTDEPWGVRRFFVNDPAGNTLNVLAHVN